MNDAPEWDPEALLRTGVNKLRQRLELDENLAADELTPEAWLQVADAYLALEEAQAAVLHITRALRRSAGSFRQGSAPN